MWMAGHGARACPTLPAATGHTGCWATVHAHEGRALPPRRGRGLRRRGFPATRAPPNPLSWVGVPWALCSGVGHPGSNRPPQVGRELPNPTRPQDPARPQAQALCFCAEDS